MRRIVPFLFLFVTAALFTESCSEIPENNDPVIGIWSRIEISDGPAGKTSQREEWIFNDAYLGRYHRYEDGRLLVKTDFGWENTGSLYIIEYPGLDREADRVTIKGSQEATLLQDLQGEILAQRE